MKRVNLTVQTALLMGAALLVGCPPPNTPATPSTMPAGGGWTETQPQGKPERIAFSSDRSGAWRIWTIDPDGSRMKQLTEGTEEEQDVDPAFAPDGRSILFTSTRGGKAGIWRMAADAGRPERICDGDQAEWSPDARRIVFRRNERIVTRDLGAGKETVITPDDLPHCSGPSWSPDGNTIAFACRWEEGNGIYLASAGGGRPVKVYDKQGACEPHWSPDGTRIVYETETNICTISPDGTKNRMVTYYGGVQRYGRFSPDGKRLVFCQAASPTGPWELYVVPSTGGEPTRLTEGGSDMYPDWK